MLLDSCKISPFNFHPVQAHTFCFQQVVISLQKRLNLIHLLSESFSLSLNLSIHPLPLTPETFLLLVKQQYSALQIDSHTEVHFLSLGHWLRPGSQCIYHLSAQCGSFLLHKHSSSCSLLRFYFAAHITLLFYYYGVDHNRVADNIKGLKAGERHR